MLGTIQTLYIQQFLYVLSLTVYSIDMEKKNLLSGEKKRKKRMCVLEYIRSYKISNLQLFHLFVEKKK